MNTAPIPASSVISLEVDWKCLEPTCDNLNDGLQVLVDKVCEPGPDFTRLVFGECVEADNDIVGILQSIIDAIQCNASTPVTSANDLLLTGLTTCSTDSWNCASEDACLTLTNACEPGVITAQVVFQALIDRIVAQGNTIKSLCTRVTTAESAITTLQAQVALIQSTCCA